MKRLAGVSVILSICVMTLISAEAFGKGEVQTFRVQPVEIRVSEFEGELTDDLQEAVQKVLTRYNRPAYEALFPAEPTAELNAVLKAPEPKYDKAIKISGVIDHELGILSEIVILFHNLDGSGTQWLVNGGLYKEVNFPPKNWTLTAIGFIIGTGTDSYWKNLEIRTYQAERIQ